LRTRALLALAALLAASVAACGGDGGGSSDVVDQANAICDRAGERAGRYAEDRSPPQGEAQVRAALAADVAIAERALRELAELDPPDDKKADFDRPGGRRRLQRTDGRGGPARQAGRRRLRARRLSV
jgi:hypothetical protein